MLDQQYRTIMKKIEQMGGLQGGKRARPKGTIQPTWSMLALCALMTSAVVLGTTDTPATWMSAEVSALRRRHTKPVSARCMKTLIDYLKGFAPQDSRETRYFWM